MIRHNITENQDEPYDVNVPRKDNFTFHTCNVKKDVISCLVRRSKSRGSLWQIHDSGVTEFFILLGIP